MGQLPGRATGRGASWANCTCSSAGLSCGNVLSGIDQIDSSYQQQLLCGGATQPQRECQQQQDYSLSVSPTLDGEQHGIALPVPEVILPAFNAKPRNQFPWVAAAIHY
jgi:hypothetical protein